MKNTKKRGFTIVELVIVIAVIAILASVLIPTFTNVVTKAKESAAMQNARSAWTAYLADEALAGHELPKEDGYIKSGDYYFKIKSGNFTGKAITTTSGIEYTIGANGKITKTATSPAGG